MQTGTIRFLSPDRHFGIIIGQNRSQYYVRLTDIQTPYTKVEVGDLVQFEVLPPSAEGRRPRAFPVKVLHTSPRNSAVSSSRRRRTDPDTEQEELFNQAQEAHRKKLYDKARSLYERVLEKSVSLEVFLELAAMERELAAEGSYERAGRVYERALKHFSEQGEIYELFGDLYTRTTPERAIEIFRRGLKFDSNHKVLHRSLAQALFTTGDVNAFSEAETHFDIAEQQGLLDPVSELQRNYIRISLGHPRGKSALIFLEKIGFTIERILSYDASVGVDLVVRANRTEYVESYGLSEGIFVRCLFKTRLLSSDVVALLKDCKKQQDSNNPETVPLNQEVLFLLAQNIQGVKDNLYKLIEDPGKNPAVVPIDETVMSETLRQANPEEHFKRHLDEWLHKRNLYEENYPVSGRRFFGREQELSGLLRTIDAGSPVGLFGLRKVGKTSLLRKLQEKLAFDLVLYVDLQSIPAGTKDVNYVYWLIAQQLQLELRHKYPLLANEVTFELAGKYDTFTPLRDKQLAPLLDSDIRLLRATIRKNDDVAFKIVIMFDEVERILPGPNTEPLKGYDHLFAYLRGICQEDEAVVWIITGANPAICDTPQWEGRDNPVFKFYKEMFIPPLEKHECKEMVERIGRGMGLTYTDNALERIFREGGGHPFVTRQLCSRIAKHHKERPLHVDVPKVETGVNEFLFEDSDIFREIMDRLQRDFPGEKEALLRIASGNNEEIPVASMARESREALKHLVGYQLVDRQGAVFKIKLNLFATWITKNWLDENPESI